MILFYAQSGSNEVVVTAPLLTFPATTSSGTYSGFRMYSVQPVKYTLLNGDVKEFIYTDIKKFIFEPKNNGHNVFKIVFSKTFKGREGCTLTLRANFSGSRFQSFNLPYIESTTLAETTASTEPLTISVKAKGANRPVTSYKVYENSSLIGDPITELTSGASIDTNTYKSVSTGTLEIVGVTIDQTASTITAEDLHTTIEREKSKYLSSSIFIDPNEGVSQHANYFYIYAEECDKEKAIGAAEDCFDSHADNTSTNSGTSLNINSCDYARRAPNNVIIEHVPGGKTALASIKYIEENLPDDITAVSHFDVHKVTTIVSGSGVDDTTPTTETINVDGDNTIAVFEWTDIDSDSEFITPFYDGRDKSVVNLSSNVGGSDDNRIYYFGIFRTQAAGCLDSTAINFDTNAVRDDGSCVFCDNTAGQVSSSLAFITNIQSNATVVDDDDNSDFTLDSTITNVESLLLKYLKTVASTVWTCKIYKEEDISLNAFGEVATSGTAILTLANSGSGTLPAFIKVPTSSSGLNSGRKFVAEIILTLGSCVHYFYKPFGVPFNGCLNPSALNYVPNSLNTGKGNCDLVDATRSSCFGDIVVTEPAGALGPDNVWNGSALLLGSYDEWGNNLDPDNSTVFTVTQMLYNAEGELVSEGSPDDIPFNYDAETGEGIPEQINWSIPAPGWTIVINIIEYSSVCNVSITDSYPDIEFEVLGCTDPTALNYNPNATEDDDSCISCSDIVFTVDSISHPTGACTGDNSDGSITWSISGNPGDFTIWWRGPGWFDVPYVEIDGGLNALTQTGLGAGVYNAYVVVQMTPDETCHIHVSPFISSLSVNTVGCGCTDPDAENYDPAATEDDGSCIVYGCTDVNAANYNPAASANDGSCIYKTEPFTPLCIPTQVDNSQTYDEFIENLKTCVVEEGNTLLLKIKAGIKCDTLDQVKLSLITYLLNRLGLECLYNCNYTFPYSDIAKSCSDRWAIGGPSGPNLVWTSGTTYLKGDIFKHVNNDSNTYYYTVMTSNGFSGLTPPTASTYVNNKLSRCQDVILPSGTETYLNTFINFAQKFCTVCIIDPLPVNIQMKSIADTLNDIQFENGDNIEL